MWWWPRDRKNQIWAVFFVVTFLLAQVWWFPSGTVEPVLFGWFPGWLLYMAVVCVLILLTQWSYSSYVWKEGRAQVRNPAVLDPEWIKGREAFLER